MSRRNLVILLCIAFVTASVATGIFYGLVGNRLRDASAPAPRQPVAMARHSEPVTETRGVSQEASAGVGVAPGMRAVTVHAWDSSGVVGLLRAGHCVDVQVLRGREGAELRLRTMLQNVEVLAVPPPEAAGRATAPVTLLAGPADADRLALADAAGRIRLLLRNPMDKTQGARPSLTMANIFSGGDGGRHQGRDADVRIMASRGGNEDFPGRIQLLARVAAARHSAVETIAANSHGSASGEALQILPLATGSGSDQNLRRLEAAHQLEMLSSTRLAAGANRTVSMQTGTAWNAPADATRPEKWGLRVGFRAFGGRNGMFRVRVHPEITTARSAGVAARQMESEVELVDGQSFVILGLSDAGEWPTLAERLFAGRVKDVGDRELIVLVTLELPTPARGVTLASRR